MKKRIDGFFRVFFCCCDIQNSFPVMEHIITKKTRKAEIFSYV